MTSLEAINLGQDAVYISLLLAAPLLGVGLAVGLLVAIFQATTQIQEMTLTFVPKIIAVLLSLLFFLPWMLRIIVEYTIQLITNIPTFVG